MRKLVRKGWVVLGGAAAVGLPCPATAASLAMMATRSAVLVPQGGAVPGRPQPRAVPSGGSNSAPIRAPVTTDADGWPLPVMPGVTPSRGAARPVDFSGATGVGTDGLRGDQNDTNLLGPMSAVIRAATRAAEQRAAATTPVPGQAGWPANRAVAPLSGLAPNSLGRERAASASGGFDNPRTSQGTAPPPAPGGAAWVATPTDRLDSSLRQVFESVGQPFDFAQLGGATARVRLHVLGPSGEVLATRELTHEAELGADRDRIESADGRRVRARDGAVAFELVDGVLWHGRAAAARAELELLGTLLRLPWSFGDGQRFVVFPRENVQLGGQPMVRLRIGPRPKSEQIGPSPQEAEGPRYELWCEPTTMRPVEVRYRLHPETVERRVMLRDWRPVQGGLRVPVRRVLMDAAGRPTLEIEIVRMRLGLRFGRDRFRAPARGR